MRGEGTVRTPGEYWPTRDLSSDGKQVIHHMRNVLRIVCVLATLLLFLILTGSAQAQSFKDVSPSHPYYTAIEGIADLSIVGGYTNGNFGPSDPVIRQQLAKMIALTMGFTVTDQDSHEFNDVQESTSALYPYHFIASAANNGLMLGYADGSFGPFKQTTRMQLITIVARATGSLLAEPPDDWRGVLDSSNPTHGRNIRWAEYGGLLKGISNLATWDTTKPTTRGEVAQILYNLLVKTSYRPPLTVANYGAEGDGQSDDTHAIQAAIDARPTGGTVILPAGTYLVSSTVSLRSDITLQGAPGQTVLTMPAQASETTFILQGDGLSDTEVIGITFRASSYASNVGGLIMVGAQDCSARELRFEGLSYGLKLGSGPGAEGWVVENIVARNCLRPLFMAKIQDSSFVNLDLEAVKLDNQQHSLYIERDCFRLSFTDVVLRGGGGYCLHLYAEGGASHDITFTNLVADATNGRYGVVIGGTFSDVTFSGLTIRQQDTSGPCINFHDPRNVVIDGIEAEGGSSLIGCATAPDSYPVDCAVKNGTYRGPQIGEIPGVTVAGLTLL